jgi:cell division transport system permease protein
MPRGHNVRALITVLAIMAFLAALALLFSRATSRLSGDWQAQLSNSATVQVSLAPLSAENDFETQMDQAAETLRSLLGNEAKVTVVDRSQSQELIKPWIGNLELPESLVLPGLITIETAENSNAPNAVLLETQLQKNGIVASVDDHSRWTDQIRGTARLLVFGGTFLLILLLIAGISVNLFATRSAMAAQRSIISVLAQVGATDGFISRLFVGQAGRRSASGAGVGLIIAWALWAVMSLFSSLPELFWSGLGEAFNDMLWLLGLWALFVLVCAVAAGLATKRALIRERKRA